MGNETIPYGQNFTSIDKKTLSKMTIIIDKIYPMVISKTWIVNNLYAASKIIAGSTVELDIDNKYTLDVVGSMRVTDDTILYGNVSIHKALYVNNANISNAHMNNASIDTLFVNYLDTDINDLYIHENLYVYNNVSITGDLYNFSTTSLNYLNVLNVSVINKINVSAKMDIGQINNPVKFDLVAEQDNAGIIYTGQLSINPGINGLIPDKTIEINGIDSSLNLNGNIQINCVPGLNNNFFLKKGGQIEFEGTTYFKSVDLGYSSINYELGSQIDTNYVLNVSGNTNITKDLTIGGNITHFSDYKLKTNLIKLENSLNKINNINGYTYNRIDFNTSKRYTGLIAQEVEKEYPDIVEYTNDIRSINYQSFTAILIECIKELNVKVTELEKNNK